MNEVCNCDHQMRMLICSKNVKISNVTAVVLGGCLIVSFLRSERLKLRKEMNMRDKFHTPCFPKGASSSLPA